jgi:hypothetical protein
MTFGDAFYIRRGQASFFELPKHRSFSCNDINNVLAADHAPVCHLTRIVICRKRTESHIVQEAGL